MTVYADYMFYLSQYFGRKLTEEEFGSYVLRASVLIDEMTGGRAAASECDEVKYACCAVCEQMYLNDKHKDIASETVGKVSRTYLAQKPRQLCMDAARAYLINTGLLGTGVRFNGVG